MQGREALVVLLDRRQALPWLNKQVLLNRLQAVPVPYFSSFI